MKRAVLGVVAGCVLGIGAASADTALVMMSPQNLKANRFTLESRTAKQESVEFVIRRDVRGIDGPGTAGYLSYPAVDGKSLGTPVKLETEHDGKVLKFRVSVPAEQVAESQLPSGDRGPGAKGLPSASAWRSSGPR